MKFSGIFAIACATLPVFGAAVPAEEASLEARYKSPGEVLSGAVTKIQTAVNKLDVIIRNITDASTIDIGVLLGGAVNVQDTIVNQTKVAQKAGKVDTNCADYLQTFVVKLIKAVSGLAKDLNSKYPLLREATLDCPTVIIVRDQKNVSDIFADVLISKVPKNRVALATKDKAQVDAALQSIINKYNTTNCNFG